MLLHFVPLLAKWMSAWNTLWDQCIWEKITFVWWDNKKSYICNKMNNLDLSENQRLGGGSKAKAVPSVDPGQCFESRFMSSKLSRCPPAWTLMTSQKHLWHLRKSSSDKGTQHRYCLALVKATMPYQRARHLLCGVSDGACGLLQGCLCFLKVHKRPHLLLTGRTSSTRLPQLGGWDGWGTENVFVCWEFA